MKDRLPIAISIAALVVALLGVTGLGEAAQNGVTAGVSKAGQATGLTAQRSTAQAHRGPRGRRGPRGYRGYRGFRGFQGPPGDKGDKGDVGPSNAFATKYCSLIVSGCAGTPLDLTWSSRDTAPFVVTLNLPQGSYVVSAQVTVKPIDMPSNWRIECYVQAPLSAGGGEGYGSARLRGGIDADDAGEVTIPIFLGTTLPTDGAAGLKCYRNAGSGEDPTIARAAMVATRVGAFTSTG